MLASFRKIETPVNRLIQKPNHITGYRRSSGWSAVVGHRPSSAIEITAAPPATSDIPSVWTNNNAGKAHRLGDSRTHVLYDNDSSQPRNSIANDPHFARHLPRSCRSESRQWPAR